MGKVYFVTLMGLSSFLVPSIALAYIEPSVGGLLFQYFYLIVNGILLYIFIQPIKNAYFSVKSKILKWRSKK